LNIYQAIISFSKTKPKPYLL